MAQRIIYNNDSGGVSCVTPTPEWLESHTLEELAVRVVPQGVEYQIVDESEITPDPLPAPIPDWVAFRRDLLASEVYTAIKLANFTPTTYHLPGELSAALVVDSPSPPIVAGLWNQLIRPLTPGQIEWLRGAVTRNHIPLVVADNGTITPT